MCPSLVKSTFSTSKCTAITGPAFTMFTVHCIRLAKVHSSLCDALYVGHQTLSRESSLVTVLEFAARHTLGQQN